MKRRIRLIPLCILLFTHTAMAADTCPVAADMAKMAADTFSSNQKKGIQLFIKAKNFCDHPEYGVNLAMAYWEYGAREKAISEMEAVVADSSCADWKNSLAAMYVETGMKGKTAVSLAEAAVEKEGNRPRFHHTLIEARLLSKDTKGALSASRNAMEKWSRESRISDLHTRVLDRRMTEGLKAVKAGKVDAGIRILEETEFHPKGLRCLVLSLAVTGQTDTALAKAKDAEQAFLGNDEVQGLRDEIFSGEARKLYERFKKEDEIGALAQARRLHERYKESPVLKETYDKLFDWVVHDETGDVPLKDDIWVERKQTQTETSDEYLNELWPPAREDALVQPECDVDTKIPKARQKNVDAIAVVIGNQKYAREGKGLPDVAYAERDAAVMKKYMEVTFGYDPKNILHVTNASSAELRELFGTKENPRGRLANYVLEGESDVFIYYSGHGAPGPNGKTAYLVPTDASADYIATNGYSLDTFYANLAKIPVRSMTVVLDACFSGDSPGGQLFTNMSQALLKTVKPVKTLENANIFCSADKDQVATWYPEMRHGLFTYFFLKGLSGDADRDRNRSVTAFELKTYLGKMVPHWANRNSNRNQTPLVTGDGARVLVSLK